MKISLGLSAIAITLLGIIVYYGLDDTNDEIGIMLYSAAVLLSFSVLVACLCPIVLYKTNYSSLNYETIISDKLRALESE